MNKTCPDCKKDKPLSDFYKDKQQKNGLKPYCKVCVKKQCAKHYIDNQDTLRKKCIIWYRNNRKKVLIYHKKYYEKNKKRILQVHTTYNKTIAKNIMCARNAVSNAIRNNKLKKQPCEVCGELKVQAHHEDYSKPLEVNWLCKDHHSELHRKTI